MRSTDFCHPRQSMTSTRISCGFRLREKATFAALFRTGDSRRFTPRESLRRAPTWAMRALSSLHAVASTEPLTFRRPCSFAKGARSRVLSSCGTPDRGRSHLAAREGDEARTTQNAFSRGMLLRGAFTDLATLPTRFGSTRLFACHGRIRGGLDPRPRDRCDSTALLRTSTTSYEICNTTRPVSTPTSLRSPRAPGPIARRAMLLRRPACAGDRAADPTIHLRSPGCRPFGEPLAWRRTEEAGDARVEMTHVAPVPHSSAPPSLPLVAHPSRAESGYLLRWRRTGLGSRSATSPRRAMALRKPGSFPLVEILASHRGSLRVCAGTGLLLPRPLRATSEESLRLWNRRFGLR